MSDKNKFPGKWGKSSTSTTDAVAPPPGKASEPPVTTAASSPQPQTQTQLQTQTQETPSTIRNDKYFVCECIDVILEAIIPVDKSALKKRCLATAIALAIIFISIWLFFRMFTCKLRTSREPRQRSARPRRRRRSC